MSTAFSPTSIPLSIIPVGARRPNGTSARVAFGRRQPTLPFNGYAAQVANLYTGMDLRKFF